MLSFPAVGKSGSVGVLHLIEQESDFDFVLSNPPAPPYAPIIKPKDFTRNNILRLRDSKFVSAIVLINDTSGLESFSHESKCPNQFFRYSKQPTCDVNKPETIWNPFGSGLLHENFDIPIIFISDKNESAKVIKCFNDFNKNVEDQSTRSLCSIELSAQMSAAGNSEICMRRNHLGGGLSQLKYCDPLQGKNVYATLFPRKIEEQPDNRTADANEKFIIISAHLDTTSMFDGVGIGATELSSVATLITSGHFLRKLLTNDVYEKNNLNVLFMLFNGESYDYIGSQRFLYDLKNNDFPSPMTCTRPLSLDNVIMMIDLGPLDFLDQLSMYHVNDFPLASKFVESLQYYNSQLKMNVSIQAETTNNIPPVSAQTFLRENASFPVIVIATKKPENKFYHSIYDNEENINFTYRNTSKDFDLLDIVGASNEFSDSTIQIKIRNVATIIALGIYDILKDNKYTQSQIASSALVDEFLFCYAIQTDCRLLRSVNVFQGSFSGHSGPPQRYVSVQSAIVTLEATGWAKMILGYLLSEKIPEVAEENCTSLPYSWFPGSTMTGECRLTTQNYSTALSPAFIEDGYNFQSNKYSTWTESTWNDLSARIFLRPSPTHESLTFSIGFTVMILSFVIVYLINSKADVLFGEVNVEHVSLPAQC